MNRPMLTGLKVDQGSEEIVRLIFEPVDPAIVDLTGEGDPIVESIKALETIPCFVVSRYFFRLASSRLADSDS